MRILLLNPGKLPHFKYLTFYPRLGLRILDSLTPPGHEVVHREHEQLAGLDFDEKFDLAAISVLTPFAVTAYAIADQFRARGVKVVLGGVHPSLMPEDAKQHADAVLVGRAENTWPRLLADAEQNKLQPFYREEKPSFNFVSPKRYADDAQRYRNLFPVQSGIGCDGRCVFCTVPPLWSLKFQPRPIEEIIAELRHIISIAGAAPQILFNEIFVDLPEYAEKLCGEIAPLRLQWSVEGELHKLQDPTYVNLLKTAGCTTIYVESKMYSPRTQPKMVEKYSTAIRHLQNHGIQIIFNFTVGYDDHDESIFPEMKAFIMEMNMPASAVIQLLVPWPGTPYYNRLEREGRILTTDWSRYDNTQVVFTPKKMSGETLLTLYKQINQELGQYRMKR